VRRSWTKQDFANRFGFLALGQAPYGNRFEGKYFNWAQNRNAIFGFLEFVFSISKVAAEK
jgi:hypothetical protein